MAADSSYDAAASSASATGSAALPVPDSVAVTATTSGGTTTTIKIVPVKLGVKEKLTIYVPVFAPGWIVPWIKSRIAGKHVFFEVVEASTNVALQRAKKRKQGYVRALHLFLLDLDTSEVADEDKAALKRDLGTEENCIYVPNRVWNVDAECKEFGEYLETQDNRMFRRFESPVNGPQFLVDMPDGTAVHVLLDDGTVCKKEEVMDNVVSFPELSVTTTMYFVFRDVLRSEKPIELRARPPRVGRAYWSLLIEDVSEDLEDVVLFSDILAHYYILKSVKGLETFTVILNSIGNEARNVEATNELFAILSKMHEQTAASIPKVERLYAARETAQALLKTHKDNDWAAYIVRKTDFLEPPEPLPASARDRAPRLMRDSHAGYGGAGGFGFNKMPRMNRQYSCDPPPAPRDRNVSKSMAPHAEVLEAVVDIERY